MDIRPLQIPQPVPKRGTHAPIRPAPIITVLDTTQVIHRPTYFFGGRRRFGFWPDLMFSRLAGDWT